MIQGELLNDIRRINVCYKENCLMIQGHLLYDTRELLKDTRSSCVVLKCFWKKTIEKQLFIFILFSEKSN